MEIPLSPNDSCRLLAVNLYSYVDNPFTKNATFNFTKFKKHVIIAQRLMDDILDLELEKIDKILEKIESDPESELTKRTEKELWLNIKQSAINGRRTGLGTTAWGDMFAALNMKYATDESNKFAGEVIKAKAIAEYSSSCILAKERGTFPVYDKELEKDDKFMNLLFSESTELKELHDLYGRRNISISTQAPQGSTSLMTQSSSGIEPVFMLFYKRRKKVNPNDKDVKIDFVDDIGDKWTEYNVIHPKFIDYCNIVHNISKEELQVMEESKLNELIEQSPYYKSLVNDIDYIKSVELQGIAQSHISHSISKTCNLPKTVTEDEVSDLYLKAWEVGCKGFTIYRDGSRSGVLVSNEPTTPKKEVIVNRPKELPCDIHHVTANGEKYYVLIGLLNDKPYELFAFSKKYISIPTIKKEGRLIKIKSGVYNLKYNGTTIENITEHFDSPLEDAFTRVVSRMLRSNITIADICKDLDKSYSDVSSFYKAISRTLRKNYMTDIEIINNNGNKCSDCGSTNLAIQEGCMICLDCGSSKCG